MNMIISIILSVFGLLTLLSAVAMIIIARKRKQANIRVNFNKPFIAQFLIGLATCLTAAFFMWNGKIFGENTTGIAQVMGIIGIGLIATSGVTLNAFMRKSDKE